MENKLLEKAILLARAGGREQAIPLLMHIVRVDPTNQEALNLLVDLLDENQRRAALSAFVKESSQYQSSRLILEALSPSRDPDSIMTEEGEPDLPLDLPVTVPIEDGQGISAASADPFNTWVSEDTITEAENHAEVEPALPMPDAETEQAQASTPLDLPPDEESIARLPDEPGAPATPPPTPQESDFLAELQSLSSAQPGGNLENGSPVPLEDVDRSAEDGQVPDLDAMREKEIYRFDAAPDPGEIEAKPVTFEQAAAHAASKERLRRRRQRTWLIPLVLFLVLGVIATLAFILNNPVSRANLAGIIPVISSATPTPTMTALPSATLAPSLTPTQAATSTQEASPTPAATETPVPTIPPVAGQVIQAEQDGMSLVYIPQGSFSMGWKFGDPGEYPEHQVKLDAFWIDQTEVTNRMYAACVASGACAPPANFGSYKQADYYANPEYADFPVVYVNWQQATAYCTWTRRRLPTEAEWEYAARGEDGRLYPWGKEAPTKELANFNHLFVDTTRVGSFPDGASPYGVLDMAGNVAEWVSDWYLESYYARSALENPRGPSEGAVRAFRGGSFANVGEKIRSSRRVHDDAVYNSSSLGFRCAMDAP